MDGIVGAFDEDQSVDGRFDKFILGGVAGWPAAKSSTQVSQPIYPAPPVTTTFIVILPHV
jgi:hypothetical protein